MDVFVVHHVHLFDDDTEDVKLIGIYSSYELAQDAVNRTQPLPGFCYASEGFSIDRYVVNKDYWTEGYATITD